MGTRHIIAVVLNGELKVSQYGQWDGYFSGKGVDFVNWVRDNLKSRNKRQYEYRMESFKEKVSCCGCVDNVWVEEFQKAITKFSTFTTTPINDFVLPYRTLMPVFHRDTSVNILDIIADIPAYEYRSYNNEPKRYFPVQVETDTGMIEYIYVLDLDREFIYCLTSHDFDTRFMSEEPLPGIIQITFANKGFEMFYASPIQKLPTASKIKDYVEKNLLL